MAQTMAENALPIATSPKRLNNLVMELLHIASPASLAGEWTFTNPREGWVYFRSNASVKDGGKLTVRLEGITPEEALLFHDRKRNNQPQEAMRFLSAGTHRLSVQKEGNASLRSLTVRAVPELMFCKYRYDPHVRPHGPYDWKFMQKYILPHVNTVVGTGDPDHQPMIEECKSRGMRWFQEVYAKPYFEEMSADQAFQFWVHAAGYSNPLIDGILADEFTSGNEKVYPAMIESIQRLREHAPSKYFYPYCGRMYGTPLSEKFIQTIIDAGSRFAWEVYLMEPASEAEAQAVLQKRLTLPMLEWKKAFPNAQNHMIVALGYMSAPTESLNVNPNVDFKVWMDMQFRHLATDPAYQGLYGLMEYLSGYADEETVRWAVRLYRHYGIEGKTDLLSKELGYSFTHSHLQNPDFADGTTGWVVDAAEEGSIVPKVVKDFGWLQGRYPKTALGDTVLWMKRSARKPNIISQEIKNLKPGQLYSLKMFSADYRDLTEGKSQKKKQAITIKIDGVELLPRKCFQFTFPNCYSHHSGPFTDKYSAWMNYHVRVFRAKGNTARLTISDWAEASKPGGPIGQEIILNFLEVQPYYYAE
jgi:hypothetical protein